MCPTGWPLRPKPEAYRSKSIEEILDQRLTSAEAEPPKDSVGEAIDRIRELRTQNTLGGLRAKDLIHEGHKY